MAYAENRDSKPRGCAILDSGPAIGVPDRCTEQGGHRCPAKIIKTKRAAAR